MKKERIRMTISIDLDTYELLEQIKGLTGEPYSKQISNLLREMRPALEMFLGISKTVKALENSKKEELSRVVKGFDERFDALKQKAEFLIDDTNEQMDLFSKAVSRRVKIASENAEKSSLGGAKKKGKKKAEKMG